MPRCGGSKRRPVLRDGGDRATLVDQLVALAEAKAWMVLACALLPTHSHLLVRTCRRPLAAAWRSLLTGSAGAFRRRHTRPGHLFQNRYTSIVVEAEPYPAAENGPSAALG